LKALQVIENMGNAARQNRLIAAQYFLDNPSEFLFLLQKTFDPDYKYHHKAAWVLEFVLDKNFDLLLPYLDFFTSNISKLQNDSAIRPIAKICEWIAIKYSHKNSKQLQTILSQKHITAIIETGFDWLIGDYKVATKAYTMHTLYMLGKLPDAPKWIHQELRTVIAERMEVESAAFKSRGRKILALLKE